MELIFLVGLILVGFGLTKANILNIKRATWLNKWIIYVALPAVAILKIPFLELNREVFVPALSPFIVFGISALLFLGIFRTKFTQNEKVALTIASGLGNTSFIGFPLISFYFGSAMLPYAVIFDQGSFFLLATFAQYLILSRDGQFTWVHSIKRILTFPPFIALCLAFLIPSEWVFGFQKEALTWLSKTISPVAMVVVGFQIARFLNLHFSKALFYSLGYKLLLAPIIIAAFARWFGADETVFTVSTFEAGMPSMITGIILLTDAQIESKLAAQLLFWGTLLGFVSTFLMGQSL